MYVIKTLFYLSFIANFAFAESYSPHSFLKIGIQDSSIFSGCSAQQTFQSLGHDLFSVLSICIAEYNPNWKALVMLYLSSYIEHAQLLHCWARMGRLLLRPEGPTLYRPICFDAL